jgi:hypothetical protein
MMDEDKHYWYKLISEGFYSALDALKTVKPHCPEWDFCWSILSSYKSYAERRDEKMRENKQDE